MEVINVTRRMTKVPVKGAGGHKSEVMFGVSEPFYWRHESRNSPANRQSETNAFLGI
jgi:hypothetical protein